MRPWRPAAASCQAVLLKPAICTRSCLIIAPHQPALAGRPLQRGGLRAGLPSRRRGRRRAARAFCRTLSRHALLGPCLHRQRGHRTASRAALRRRLPSLLLLLLLPVWHSRLQQLWLQHPLHGQAAAALPRSEPASLLIPSIRLTGLPRGLLACAAPLLPQPRLRRRPLLVLPRPVHPPRPPALLVCQGPARRAGAVLAVPRARRQAGAELPVLRLWRRCGG